MTERLFQVMKDNGEHWEVRYGGGAGVAWNPVEPTSLASMGEDNRQADVLPAAVLVVAGAAIAVAAPYVTKWVRGTAVPVLRKTWLRVSGKKAELAPTADGNDQEEPDGPSPAVEGPDEGVDLEELDSD